MSSDSPLTPVTVLSGFLGAGKTTIGLHLVRQLSSSYKVAWLKNEYGEVATDSRLAAESSINVTEMINGCVCCTAVGKLGPALSELLARYQPDRILLETSGSSHPAPLAWELKRLADGGMRIKLDAIICVIDAVNFSGYEDRSLTARLQTKCTDLILINKHELATPSQLESVLDSVCELNPATPRVRTNKGFVDHRLMLGIDSKLWAQASLGEEAQAAAKAEQHDDTDVRVLDLTVPANTPLPWSRWESMLASLPRDSFYRVKGVLMLTEPQPGDEQTAAAAATATTSQAHTVPALSADATAHAHDCSCDQHSHSTASTAAVTAPAAASSSAPAVPAFPYLLNWAFGRHELLPFRSEVYTGPTRCSFMGDRDIVRSQRAICTQLQVEPTCIKLLETR